MAGQMMSDLLTLLGQRREDYSHQVTERIESEDNHIFIPVSWDPRSQRTRCLKDF